MSETKLGNIEYAIFDMDGLLSGSCVLMELLTDGAVDTERIYTDVTNVMLQRYGYTQKMTWAMKTEQMGKPARKAAESLFSHFPGLSEKVTYEKWLEERNVLQEQAFRSVEPMRGAIALVKGLHARGVPIAIATGSAMNNFRWKTSHLPELFSLFKPENILSADSKEVARGKPFPDIYLAAAQSLGRDVGTADSATEAQLAERKKGIVFEDAVLGLKAGLAAGMSVVWVPDENLLALNPTETHGATQILPHLEDFKPAQWGLPDFNVAAEAEKL